MKKMLLVIFILSQALYAEEFKFAVWSDTQFQNAEVFAEFVRSTELLKPALVIHSGDMIHGYTYNIDIARRQWAMFKQQIKPLSMPFYPTPGNHDLTTKEIQPAYLETWGNDKLYYSFDHLNSHFIILNTTHEQILDSLPEVQLEWLKQDLAKTGKQKNIFISLHSPLQLGKKHRFTPFHDIIKEYPVKGVFTGHYHVYDYRVLDGVPYFCLVTSGNMNFQNHLAGYSHHMLLASVNGNDVDYAVITQDGIYAKDEVMPWEFSRSVKFFERDNSILVPDPSVDGFSRQITAPIKNNSDTLRSYNIYWKGRDYRWKFEPMGLSLTLKPGEVYQAVFNVTAPKAAIARDSMPSLCVTSPYRTLNGRTTSSSYEYKLFSPPMVSASETFTAPDMNGNPTEECWKNVKGIENLVTDFHNTPAGEKTSVKIVYDDNSLYIGVRGEETAPQRLTSMAYGKLPLVFGDDDFEIFFDNDSELSTFYRIILNPKGTVLASGPMGLYSFKYEVSTYVGDDYWSAEIKVPFSELNLVKPQKGTRWRFNVRRNRLQSEKYQSDWSKMQQYPPYQPHYFGVMEFR